MKVPELTEEVRALIKQKHAHRFPELRYFPKPGDDGRLVRLPVILGNPSGACKMPDGERSSPAWKGAVAATFGARSAFDYGPLVTDCVLWPEPAVFAQWCERWPALVESLRPAVVRKYGGALSSLTEPADAAPVEIATALAANPGAARVRFSASGKALDLVITPPPSHVWSLFIEAIKARDADTWALALDLAINSVAFSSSPIGAAIERWPGLALLIVQQVSYLAGLVTEYEEGEL